jgi:hypothetical protein
MLEIPDRGDNARPTLNRRKPTGFNLSGAPLIR